MKTHASISVIEPIITSPPFSVFKVQMPLGHSFSVTKIVFFFNLNLLFLLRTQIFKRDEEKISRNPD